MTTRRESLAAALAGAFLAAGTAGDWDAPALEAAGRTVLGRTTPWLRWLAVEVLSDHPRPPTDAPRAFAAYLHDTGTLQRAADRARRRRRALPRVVARPVVPTTMGVRRWPVPRLDDVGALCELLGEDLGHLEWLADPRSFTRRAPGGGLHAHRSMWLTRPGRTPRLLEAPRPRLRALQRTVLHAILDPVPLHPGAHGFVRGRSALTHARLHTDAEVVLRMDLEAFFASVSAPRVFGVFRTLGYPEAVAHLLTALCTISTPLVVLRAMPPGGSDDARWRLRSWLGHAHLAQGVPTSPALANLCSYPLDRRLAALAASWQLTYSRYADDLCFSGQLGDADLFARTVTTVVREEGFRVNAAKTRTRRAWSRQQVTGIVVNSGTNVTRADYDRLKAVLHEASTHGPAAANRAQVPDFAAHLLGRIAWVGSLNPQRGRRLREVYDTIAF